MARGTADGRTELDRKGGPGHTVLLALLAAVPLVKIAWTVGGGSHTREVVTTMGVPNLGEVLVGMVTTRPLLGSLVAVVTSRVVFALFAARGAVPSGRSAGAAARTVALTLVNPLAMGVLCWVFYGPWWGLAVALASLLLRQGLVQEYRAGRRPRPPGHPHDDAPAGRPAAAAPAPWRLRLVAAEQWAALLLTVLVLPVTAFAAALDGLDWDTVLRCEVAVGTRSEPSRLIELHREGNGVVGWDLHAQEVVNGLGCVKEESLRVRPAWWNS
ncbi:hypothetical protein [Kitasatospora phosalacinea]|uniref:Uncharacterized protein n=1 Tax=Kitasatospora phosalacinea TaxID=2065 RepID=A0A9W6UPE3_9ACTN|nr:hypothetical protein [Kitasatospora phosalacinea]GLW54495.1 hypothetical protein Kpho01_25060 [Kitasatospora phosalacinea]